MAKRKRRRIEPADNHTPDLTPRCEAKDCGEPLPLYFAQLPGLERRVWLCPTHFGYWRLDLMRAQTIAWQKEQQALQAARIEEWALNHVSVVARLEAELGPMPLEWVKPSVIDIGGATVSVFLPRLGPVARTLDWGADQRIGQVVLDG